LNYQKADFNSVWEDFSVDSLSDSEQGLFEQPKEVTPGEINLWKELETIQPVFEHSISMEQNCGLQSGDKFDRIFSEGVNRNANILNNDPMVSSSFELETPQHPFEETLLLPEDPMEDIDSPRSTIYYPSSPDDEEAGTDTYTTEASVVQASPPPTGYPNSIHSYSQLSAATHINDNVSEDIIVADEPVVNEVIQVESTGEAKNKSLGIQNVSPFKSKGRRRQRKSRMFKITISEPSKISPKKRTFANGKSKLYTMKALADPEAEKARQNAINAKKNRELKKKERELIAREVITLKQENGTLKRNAAAMRKRASDAEAELRRLQAAIRANQLEDIIKAAGNKNKESDKVSYFNINNSSNMDLESLW
jgi:hypothetical protein